MKMLLVLLHDWGTVFPWAGQTHQVFILSLSCVFKSTKEPRGPHSEVMVIHLLRGRETSPDVGLQFARVNNFTSVEVLARLLESPKSLSEGGRGLRAPLADAEHRGTGRQARLVQGRVGIILAAEAGGQVPRL